MIWKEQRHHRRSSISWDYPRRGKPRASQFRASKNKQRGKGANSQLINFEEREKPPLLITILKSWLARKLLLSVSADVALQLASLWESLWPTRCNPLLEDKLQNIRPGRKSSNREQWGRGFGGQWRGKLPSGLWLREDQCHQSYQAQSRGGGGNKVLLGRRSCEGRGPPRSVRSRKRRRLQLRTCGSFFLTVQVKRKCENSAQSAQN